MWFLFLVFLDNAISGSKTGKRTLRHTSQSSKDRKKWSGNLDTRASPYYPIASFADTIRKLVIQPYTSNYTSLT